ncbi:MAG: TIGR04282 family arsenosugar biosynthesis glycosyltransferase [Litoreibacter sp.]|nr:TIGR04282 family arsenosugar biosynthesis glycosyltransferase [Litoreibacter sp.]MCY4337099.1 TIGR04282 family arsenosugar biosynthesis glycosyltransferase [Litoreibacter sp.]
MRKTLIVMLKEPRPGRVKTRLGAGLGLVGAAWWYRHQVARLLREVDDPRWRVVLAVAPDNEGLTSRIWPSNFMRLPQGSGDLGMRMKRALSTVGPGPVCLIGSDIPGIRKRHIADAFAALGASDAVFGPSEDGGYWLVGVKRGVPHGMFAGVRWSSAHALADSEASLTGVRVTRVAQLRDVDTVDDL